MTSFVKSRSFSFCLVLAMIFLLSGCLAGKTKKSCPLLVDVGFSVASERMDPSFYPQETKKWQAVLQETGDSKKKAEAHLHMASLYFSPNNPQKNYHTGYVELTRATTAYPDLRENKNFVSWLELLSRIEDEQQSDKKDIIELENRLARSQQQIATQRQEIVKLRETLNRLKMLELNVERKRRAFK